MNRSEESYRDSGEGDMCEEEHMCEEEDISEEEHLCE